MLELNKIYKGNCTKLLQEIDDSIIDLVVSSPPYNVGINYDGVDDNRDWQDYEVWMTDVIGFIYKKLKNGGRVVWNIPSFSSKQNLYEIFLRIFRSCGFQQYAEIIWDKKQISSRTAWGSFKSASQPNILPSHEYILVFYKETKNHGKGENNITNDEFVKWTDGMWHFKPETQSDHPAPFPIELAERSIKMFSHKSDLVLDPFIGSGTVAIACQKWRRKFIGFEISEKYVEMANKRLSQKNLNEVTDGNSSQA